MIGFCQCLTLTTLNVNGLNSLKRHRLLDWKRGKGTTYCLQETHFIQKNIQIQYTESVMMEKDTPLNQNPRTIKNKNLLFRYSRYQLMPKDSISLQTGKGNSLTARANNSKPTLINSTASNKTTRFKRRDGHKRNLSGVFISPLGQIDRSKQKKSTKTC